MLKLCSLFDDTYAMVVRGSTRPEGDKHQPGFCSNGSCTILKLNSMELLDSLTGVYEQFVQPTGTESQQIDLSPAFFCLDNSPAMIILYDSFNLISGKG